MNSELETTKLDYVIRNVCKQVYNVFPFASIRCEPSWDKRDYDICARWHYKGSEHGFKYTMTYDALDYFGDLDYIVYSLVHQIYDVIIKSCKEEDKEEVTNE